MTTPARKDAALRIRVGKIYRCVDTHYECQVIRVEIAGVQLWPSNGDVEYRITGRVPEAPDRSLVGRVEGGIVTERASTSIGKVFGDDADIFLSRWTPIEGS